MHRCIQIQGLLVGRGLLGRWRRRIGVLPDILQPAQIFPRLWWSSQFGGIHQRIQFTRGSVQLGAFAGFPAAQQRDQLLASILPEPGKQGFHKFHNLLLAAPALTLAHIFAEDFRYTGWLGPG